MQQIVSQVLHFLQTGIEAIFHFVEMIWTWAVHQVTKLVEVPWQDWPVLKVLLLIVIAAAVIWALYRVFWELWLGAERVLSAFAGLLVRRPRSDRSGAVRPSLRAEQESARRLV